MQRCKPFAIINNGEDSTYYAVGRLIYSGRTKPSIVTRWKSEEIEMYEEAFNILKKKNFQKLKKINQLTKEMIAEYSISA
ncbi:MAG: hypothetical protein HRK26_04155 [Rickettsiaceae bacterium H1]|nr:hypothetical protein [Rickettsiaceae bacterium H1]